MIDDNELKMLFCKTCASDPFGDGWTEIVKFGRAVAIATLEDAATLIELEYAPDKRAYDRLKQIAQHVRNMTALNDSGCPGGKCTDPAHDCFGYGCIDG
jgi:hypothetical protein